MVSNSEKKTKENTQLKLCPRIYSSFIIFNSDKLCINLYLGKKIEKAIRAKTIIYYNGGQPQVAPAASVLHMADQGRDR